jgi:hypothetical protein
MLNITSVSKVCISATSPQFSPHCTSSHPVATFCFTTLFPSTIAYCHCTIPPCQLQFNPGSGYVGSVVNKVAMGQVFSEYFSFPRKSSFYWLHHTHLPSGAGRMGPPVASVPRCTPTHIKTEHGLLSSARKTSVSLFSDQWWQGNFHGCMQHRQ